MTQAAWRSLVDELARLRAEVASSAAARSSDAGVVDIGAVSAVRRLDLLTAVLDASEQVHGSDEAAIGHRAMVRESEGEIVSYALVYPGDGDPGQGQISADSPIGAALMGARAGDEIQVLAPAGRRVLTVLSVG